MGWIVRDKRYDVLFEPVVIGPLKSKNRFYQVPHCNGGGYRDPSAAAAMRAQRHGKIVAIGTDAGRVATVGESFIGGATGGTNLVLIIAGLLALTSGLSFVALGRKSRR